MSTHAFETVFNRLITRYGWLALPLLLMVVFYGLGKGAHLFFGAPALLPLYAVAFGAVLGLLFSLVLKRQNDETPRGKLKWTDSPALDRFIDRNLDLLTPLFTTFVGFIVGLMVFLLLHPWAIHSRLPLYGAVVGAALGLAMVVIAKAFTACLNFCE